jgi:hypothetical protein
MGHSHDHRPARAARARLALLLALPVAAVVACSPQGGGAPSATVAVLPPAVSTATSGTDPGAEVDIEGTACGKSIAELGRKEPSPEAFDAVAEAVRSQPCAKVRERAIAKAERDLAAWPDEARRIPEKVKPFAAQDDAVLWRLARHLEVRFADVDEAWIKGLEQPHFASITSLDISFNTYPDERSGDRGAQAIANSRALAGLRALRISSSKLSERGALSIAESKTLTSLTKLTLSESDIGDKGAQAISASGALANLTTLDLRYGVIGEDGARAIAESTSLTRLTSLLLGRNFIGEGGAKAIASSALLGRLTQLDLDFNLIGEPGAAAIAASTAAARLTDLSLRYNLIGDGGAKAIAASRSLTALKRLNLSSNEIGDAGGRALASSASLPKDLALNISYNGIADEAAAALTKAIPGAELYRDPKPSDGGLSYEGEYTFPGPRGPEVLKSKVDPPRGLPRDVRFRRLMNGRFAFAVDFPTFLVPSEPPANGDGRGFAWRSSIEMLAWGDNNASMQTLAQQLREATKEAGKGAKGAMRGASYTLSYRAGGKIIHRKTLRQHGRNVTVQITFDEAMQAYLEPIVKSVFDSIRVLGEPM